MFDVDGGSLLDALLFASLAKSKDGKETIAVLKVFRKYGFDTYDALKLLAELSIAIAVAKGEE